MPKNKPALSGLLYLTVLFIALKLNQHINAMLRLFKIFNASLITESSNILDNRMLQWV
jgi:hypothetical protein